LRRGIVGAGKGVLRVARRVFDINDAERTWIAGNLQVVRSFAMDLGIVSDETTPLDTQVLDAVWAAWLEMHVRGQEDPNSIINAFGVSFGQLLVQSLGLEWKIVHDAVTEIALCGQPGDIVIYPQNLVARRYMAGTTRFFEELAAEMAQTIGPLDRPAGAIPIEPAAAPKAVAAPKTARTAAPARRAASKAGAAAAKKPVAEPKAVGPGRTKRPARAVGPGRPEGAPGGGSAGEGLVGPVVPKAADIEPETGELVESGSGGGGFGRLFRRGGH
jgi:hypothetical protein